MTKPELPSGGGSFVREADGSLTKQRVKPSKLRAAKRKPKPKPIKPASALAQKKGA